MLSTFPLCPTLAEVGPRFAIALIAAGESPFRIAVLTIVKRLTFQPS